MSAAILPLPPRHRTLRIGDEVVIHRDDRHGHIERFLPNKIGKPALAVVRVRFGFGARLLAFNEFSPVPRREQGRAAQ
jgi:hypothetical protein